MVKTPPFHGGNTGSNPVGVTIFGGLAQLGEHLPYKQRVGGSKWGPGYKLWFEECVGKQVFALQVDHASLYIHYLQSDNFIGLLPSAIANTLIQGGELTELRYRSKVKAPFIQSYIIYPKRKHEAVKSLLDYMMQAADRM